MMTWSSTGSIFRVTGPLCVNMSPVNSSHGGQWRSALVFSLMCANSWENHRVSSDFRRYRAHYDVPLMHLYLPGMDVISRSAWSALPVSYLGEDLRNDTDFVAVGYVGYSTHAVLHTKKRETYLRGNSSHFQLCEYLYEGLSISL